MSAWADIAKLTAQRHVEQDGRVDALMRQESGGLLDAWASAISGRLAMPQTRMVIPFSSVDADDDAHDVSGQERFLSDVGGVVYDAIDGIAPFATLGATGSFERPYETGIDITGNFTALIWIRPSSFVEDAIVVGRWTGMGTFRVYEKEVAPGEQIICFIVFDPVSAGYAVNSIVINDLIANSRWMQLAARYDAGNSLSLFVNGQKTLNDTSIPAALQSSSSDLLVGSGGSSKFLGDVGLFSYHAAAVSDELIYAAWERERELLDA